MNDPLQLLSEDLIGLAEAACIASVSVRTIRRWIQVGCNGRTLEAAKLGGQFRTSREAIGRFAIFPAAARRPSFPDGSALQRHRRAERELDRMLGPHWPERPTSRRGRPSA